LVLIKDAEIQFKRQCETAIRDAKPVLSRDLGWGDFLTNLLKEIANTFISVFTANPHALFTPARSASLEHVAAVAVSLELDENRLQIGMAH
jgi:hypothetical protein